MEREVGGGIGIGNACKPMAVSFQCMTKSTTNKKKKRKKETGQDFPGGPLVKNPPANAGTLVQSLDWENSTCCGAAKPEGRNY